MQEEKMIASIQRSNDNKKSFKEIRLTQHFVDRYCNRVIKKSNCLSKLDILNDIKKRMTDREKMVLGLFAKNKNYVKVPMGAYQLVVINRKLITVY